MHREHRCRDKSPPKAHDKRPVFLSCLCHVLAGKNLAVEFVGFGDGLDGAGDFFEEVAIGEIVVGEGLI